MGDATVERIEAGDELSESADIVEANLESMRGLFPEAFSEDGIDFEVLRQLLGDEVAEGDEKYGLNWHGKKLARRIALTPSMGTLRPCPEESVDWDTTQNLMIEGDNLEVLKLLQKSYSGKVKLIYIDPPYNTGKDFVYKDNYRDSIRNYLELTGQVDGEGRKLSSNPESSGRFHTDWLNMMYPRLKLARNLLRDDGVIFMSIDDAEVENARRLLNEVFGEENFVASIAWQKKYAVSSDDPGIAAMHDYLVVYQRSGTFQRGLLPRTAKQDSRYSNPDDDPRGSWASDNYVSNKSKDERPTLWYSIEHPRTSEPVWPDESAVWRYSRDRHLELEADGRLYWGDGDSYRRPRLKRFLSEVQQGIVPSTWWSFEDVGHNDEGQKQLGSLIGKKVFSTPKPVRLLRQVLTVAHARGDLVLDFFAGSGTLGHAVAEDNAIQGTATRYILVQLPETLSTEINDQRIPAEFCDTIRKPRNLAEVTKERLRRAGAKVREEHAGWDGDVGFRVFKLDTSNIRAWSPDRDEVEASLLDYQEHLADDRSEDDILYEMLLKLGLDLCVPIEERDIGGVAVSSVGGGVLMTCLAEPIPVDAIEVLGTGIAGWLDELEPAGDTTVIFRDSAFENDVAKTNIAAILNQAGVTSVRSI